MSTTQQTKTEIKVPEGATLHEDCFYVWETRFGLHTSMTKEGRKMLTGLYEKDVVTMTRWHLKCEQEGTLDQYTRVIGDAFVGGKL